MLPTIDFNNIDELIDYIDESIITNHDNEITAEQHNNIENGLAKFIIEAPRNWDAAKVIGTAGNYVAVEGESILIFKSTASGSITLTDNKWNEWTIVNRTSGNKQLVGDIDSYRTVAGTIKNYISGNSAVTIAKGNDGTWYETSSSGASTVTGLTSPVKIQLVADMGDGISLPSGDAVDGMVAGQTVYVINDTVQDGSLDVFYQSGYLPFNDNTDFGYSAVYEEDKVTVTFNQSGVGSLSRINMNYNKILLG